MNTIKSKLLRNRNVKLVEQSNEQCKHAESWKLINKITGRKNSKRGKIKANSKEERVTIWYEHFKQLLGNNNEEYETSNTGIKTISGNNSNIKTGPFTPAEYSNVKERLTDGKAAGPDGITPEILKYCKFDDIILEFSNKMLIHHEIPNQWLNCNIVPFQNQVISKM